jgi:autotransporter adhesin
MDATAIGTNAQATAINVIALGHSATATAENATAIGNGAQATGINAVAIGSGATATGSVAVGTNARAANGGSAFGDYTTATGTQSVALGQNAAATGAQSAAVGNGAKTTGNNSVAIGANSTDESENNVVSLGSSGNERRIINVADGIKDKDAVNLAQLNDGMASTLASANAYTQRQIEELSEETHQSIAGAIAMSRALMPLAPGESGLGAGVGASGGEAAIAISLQYFIKERVHVNVGASFSESGIQTGGGIGIKF